MATPVRPALLSAQSSSYVGNEKSASVAVDELDLERRASTPTVTTKPRQPTSEIFLECGAEFIGTLIFVAFGTGGNCQYVVGAPNFDTYATVPIGWAVGLALGAGFAGNRSGGHINPAVTAMLALIGKVPWWKFPIYGLSQIAGGFVGAGISYAVYYQNINDFEGGWHRTIAKTAGLFGTYPEVDSPPFSCWLAEFFPATILLGVVLYLVSMARKPSFGTVPVVLFMTLLGVGCTFGSTTSFSINPARDLGPRLLTYAAGYGADVWTYKDQYWLWGGQMGAFSASVFVAGVYWVDKAVEKYVLHADCTEGEDLS